MTPPAEPDAKPGLLDRLRAKMPWFDHVLRAQRRYGDCKGDFYAAGITYFTIFALFPLLMVGFAVGGFVLASHPHLLDDLESRIREAISGDLGRQVVNLMDSAIASRTSVGIIGLATAMWAGLGWMANLREALSQMWGSFRKEPRGFVRTKLSDLLALIATFVAIVVTIGLTALADPDLMRKVLGWLGIDDFAAFGGMLRIASLLVSLGVSWLLFSWMIARLPRERISFHSSMRAGAIAAVGFEVFKQVASIYLRSVVTGPAGATFGPVLGLMVFAYITARLVLFATAWAAVAAENLREETIAPPPPAVINSRVIADPAMGRARTAAAVAAGAVGALGISRLRQRRKDHLSRDTR
jgi:membrane protein